MSRSYAVRLVLVGALTANLAQGFREDRGGRFWMAADAPGLSSHSSSSAKPKLGLAAVDKKEDKKDGSELFDGLKVVAGIVEAQNQGRDFGEVFGVKKNTEGDFRAFLTACVFGSSMLLFTVSVFSWLRRCFPSIYAHRVLQGDTGGEQSVPPSHDGCFGWAVAAWRVTDHEVMQAAGLDALMFLEFCRLFMKLAFFLSPVVIGVLCPLHYYTPRVTCAAFSEQSSCLPSRCTWKAPNLKEVPPIQQGYCEAKYAKDLLSVLGVNGLLQGEEPLSVTSFWIHAAMVWVVVCLALYLMYNTHLRFLKHRFSWLTQLPEPRSTTLMVENIPVEYRTDEKLQGYFSHLFTEAAVERAYMVRKTGPLRKKVAALEAKEHKLREAERQWEKDGKHPDKIPKVHSFTRLSFSGDAPNAIEVYSQEVKELKADIADERQRIEESVAHGDPSVVSSSAFVTFTSRRWARHASREHPYREDTQQWVVEMPPDPVDVVYSDLALTQDAQERGNLFSTLLLILMFLVWTPLVALSSSLTSLPQLSRMIPFLKVYCKSHPLVNDFLQGVLATLALKFLMGWLPVFLMGIIRQFRTPKAGAWAQVKLHSRYFTFQITFVLFVTTVGFSLQRTIENVMDSPKTILSLLGARLPEASHFYLNYVLLGWFTAAIELLRWPQLFYYLWNTRIAGMDAETARSASEPEDQDCYGMGSRFGRVELIMTLTVVFCTVMPLITIVGAVFFFLCNIIFGYLFVFAESKKPDLGGAFWIISLRHILFSLVLFVALMGGILSSQGREGRYPALAVIPVLLLLFLAWRRLNQFSWETLPFESVADMDHEFNRRKGMTGSITQSGCYIQPECLACLESLAVE